MALSFIQGPRVNDWVQTQAEALDLKTRCLVHPYQQTDKALWDDFEVDFRGAFTDTAKEQEAYNKLMSLGMSRNDVDTYISQFDTLVARAGWPTKSIKDQMSLASYRNGRMQPNKRYNATP